MLLLLRLFPLRIFIYFLLIFWIDEELRAYPMQENFEVQHKDKTLMQYVDDQM